MCKHGQYKLPVEKIDSETDNRLLSEKLTDKCYLKKGNYKIGKNIKSDVFYLTLRCTGEVGCGGWMLPLLRLFQSF